MIESLHLEKEIKKPLYLQLSSQLKNLIEAGQLQPHSKLPSIRQLAKKLSVNNVTVVNAYNVLEEEGLVYKKVGSGTFVLPSKQIEDEVISGENGVDTLPSERKMDVINFGTVAPSPSLFPVQVFKRLLNQVLDRDQGYAFGYQKSQGYLPLRESIAQYVENYQIETDSEQIQIVSGAQQGLDVLAKTFLDYGDTVFVERPTYPGAISAFRSRKVELIDIPLEKDGLDLEKLEVMLKRYQPKFLYLMPNFQNPTGYSYSLAKKKELLELATQYELLIIEDDCVSDLNYLGQPRKSLKSLDTEDNVVYLKSFSKIYMPGLRLAFMIIPSSYCEDILVSKYLSDIFTDGLVQRVLDLYFRNEDWQEQLSCLKEKYSQRYQVMVTALEDYLPQSVDYIEPQGGLNLWLKLPQQISATKMYEVLREDGINIAPGALFYHTKPQKNRIRLSIAAVTCQQIEQGVKQIGLRLKEELKQDRDYRFDDSLMPLV
ncbi:PLP-dependent aminotransferase family protein [Natroniella sulfidigena]|uniref:MocR-like pyridoxine biosynthesis transcription factor PdxR n=1 Tax=Natroniella sulfidigena TaxID=723921 RepID=UPI00200AA42D|nr:PLP-dependent aminotransferase family protein [Natroniella sulfidigena]MCK8817636.1 PLP-dependent aminotransferase family protein [Natroniella sulfidigena]